VSATSLSNRTDELTERDLLDTAKQWRRLEFLKWRYKQGDLQRA
jgi:hypothetical protein